MNWDNFFDLLCLVLAGMATALPLAAKLVQYVRAAAKAKNWSALLKAVLALMEKAEELYSAGAEKKEYVLQGAAAIAESIGFELDGEQLGAVIDELCAMSKKVNA